MNAIKQKSFLDITEAEQHEAVTMVDELDAWIDRLTRLRHGIVDDLEANEGLGFRQCYAVADAFTKALRKADVPR